MKSFILSATFRMKFIEYMQTVILTAGEIIEIHQIIFHVVEKNGLTNIKSNLMKELVVKTFIGYFWWKQILKNSKISSAEQKSHEGNLYKVWSQLINKNWLNIYLH